MEIAIPEAISASNSANSSSARTVCDSSMMWSLAAKQISASAIGMTTMSVAVIAEVTGFGRKGWQRAKAPSCRRLDGRRRRRFVRLFILDAVCLVRNHAGAQEAPHDLQK